MSISITLSSFTPTTLADFPSNSNSTALTPNLLARILSNADGLPPLSTCPRIVTLKSEPVFSAICFPISCALPTPSANTIMLCFLPLFLVVSNLSHILYILSGCSGNIIVSAPPASPEYKAKSPQCLPITSTIFTLS